MGGRGAGSGGGGGGGSVAGGGEPERRQTGPEDAEYQTAVRVNRWLDGEYPATTSLWTGELENVPEDEMRGALAAMNPDGSVEISRDIAADPSRREPTLLHEMLHGRSAGLDIDTYNEMRGWEEGVIENLTRLKRVRMMEETGQGHHVAQERWAEADITIYPYYVEAIERLREWLGRDDAEGFYDELLGVELAERPRYLRRRGFEAIRSGPGSPEEKTEVALDWAAEFRTQDDVLRTPW